MIELKYMVKRNIKLFFKDKGMFFTSLATPIILLVLYATFLGNIYKDTILNIIPDSINIDERIINGFVGGQLFSSLLAVSCITVSLCSNLMVVNDKVTGAIHDVMITPIKKSIVAISYFISTFISSIIVCFTAVILCFIYIVIIGWYISLSDILFIVLDVFLLVLFGTSLSTLINMFLSSQGQMSAVGTIVSSGYGFICGAYMPISQFSDGLQNILSYLPGTHGTVLLRNHSLNGPLKEMEKAGLNSEIIEAIRNTVDCNIYINDKKVEIWIMYLIVIGAIVLISSVYLIAYRLKNKNN